MPRVEEHCPNCGQKPIWLEEPEREAPTKYYCHFCNRGFNEPGKLYVITKLRGKKFYARRSGRRSAWTTRLDWANVYYNLETAQAMSGRVGGVVQEKF